MENGIPTYNRCPYSLDSAMDQINMFLSAIWMAYDALQMVFYEQ